jgi:hypothetical protein
LYVNEKMIPVETTPGILGGRNKGGEFMYNILDTL